MLHQNHDIASQPIALTCLYCISVTLTQNASSESRHCLTTNRTHLSLLHICNTHPKRFIRFTALPHNQSHVLVFIAYLWHSPKTLHQNHDTASQPIARTCLCCISVTLTQNACTVLPLFTWVWTALVTRVCTALVCLYCPGYVSVLALSCPCLRDADLPYLLPRDAARVTNFHDKQLCVDPTHTHIHIHTHTHTHTHTRTHTHAHTHAHTRTHTHTPSPNSEHTHTHPLP